MTRPLLLLVATLLLVRPRLCAQDPAPESEADKTSAAQAAYAAGPERGLDASGFEILSKTNGTDLGFYPQRLLATIRKKWYPLISQAEQASDKTPRTTVVEFTVQRDGSLGKIQVTKSSGQDALDAAAINGIKAAAPFNVVPASYQERALRLRYRFTYNREPNADRPVCGKQQREMNRAATGNRPVLRVGHGVNAPRPLYMPDPEYSEEGRRNKYQGTVMLGGTVGADGTFSDVCIEQALGSGLDERAVTAVKTWKFKPATKDNQPVAVRIAVQVTFRLY